ncbi:hypothetical protein WJX72_004652 [[Myrmecia] bisecta]|uniref:J domain-containing protein n=1 Tax=[Myrmecia] bisecta TaxID=41462 RepID=A0AAW1R7B6_9CHLO
MGMPEPTFDVDVGDLEKTYKSLQRQLHPDKFATQREEEKEYSAQQSALVNQAYNILRSPLRRAHYVLEERGVNEGEASEHTIEDPELLMEVMELREVIESTDDAEQLRALQAENDRKAEACIKDLSDAFKRDELDRAAELATQLRYITRIGEAILQKV